jgi:MinD-like ATPase involved in chromosome partitioning or flagellar assembly
VIKGKCISVHSSRGGTGKTLLAANMAVLFARRGLNVALLDLDFRAPSLMGVFSKVIKGPVEFWLNDYLDGRCQARDVVVDVSGAFGLKGKLFVGLANPSVDVIRGMAEKSRAWEVSSVKRLFSLRSALFKELGVDLCLFDTSPGVHFTSVNAVISSDLSVVVTTLDSLDLAGTKSMILDLYDAFERKTVVLFNKVFPEAHQNAGLAADSVISGIERMLGRPVLGAIPCYCDVLQTDRSTLLAVEKPDHQFVADLESVAVKLEAIIDGGEGKDVGS